MHVYVNACMFYSAISANLKWCECTDVRTKAYLHITSWYYQVAREAYVRPNPTIIEGHIVSVECDGQTQVRSCLVTNLVVSELAS